MINLICGPQSSGLGLIEEGLRRSANITVKSLSDDNDGDFSICAGLVHIYHGRKLLLKDYIDNTLVIMRCPMTSFLCILESHYNRLERDLLDEEIDFYAAMFNKRLIYINSIIGLGAQYFIIKNDDRLLKRMNDLNEIISGDRMFVERDLHAFYTSSITYRYTGMKSFSKKNRSEIERMGTIYGKYGIELEI